MKHLCFRLTLILALLWLGSGAWLPTGRAAAADSPMPDARSGSPRVAAPAQTVKPGRVPDRLRAADWRAIQAQVAKLTAADGAGERLVWLVRVGQRRHGRRRGVPRRRRRQRRPGCGLRLLPEPGRPRRLGPGGQAHRRRRRGGGLLWQLRVGQRRHGRRRGVRADVGGNVDQGAAYVFYREPGRRRRLGPGGQADRRRRRGGRLLWPVRVGQRRHGRRRGARRRRRRQRRPGRGLRLLSRTRAAPTPGARSPS